MDRGGNYKIENNKTLTSVSFDHTNSSVMRKLIPFSILIFFLAILTSNAQVNYSVPVMSACGSTVSVPVAVSGFNNVIAFQYSMQWNPAILQFDNVGSFNLQHLNSPDFGTSQTSNGKLSVAWIDDDGSGESLPNGTVIYVLNFTVLGGSGSTSSINFTDDPTPKLTGSGSPPSSVPMSTTNGSVTIGDNTPPTITCPSNRTETIVAPNTNTVINGIAPAGFSDNCGTPTVTYSTTGASPGLTGSNDASGRSFNVGTTTVTYTAKDAANNTGTCSFTVTVNQSSTPFTVSASNETSNCGASTVALSISVKGFNITKALSFTLSWDPAKLGYSSVGNFNLQHLDNGDFGISQISSGKLTMSWIDDDGTGETLSDGTVIFNVNFTPTGLPGDIIPVIFTNNPTDIVAGGGQPTMNIPVTTENGSVTIGSSSAPVISNCPSNITKANDPGQCGGNVTWTPPTATDNCPGLTVTSNKSPGDFFNVGVTTVTYTATGVTGKTATCSFTVTITDNEKPKVTCPANITKKTDIGKCTAVVTWSDNATDNCPGVTITRSHNSGDAFNLGSTTVKLTARDAVGNTDSCSFTVTVRDSVPPVFSHCPKDTVIAVAEDKCTHAFSWVAPTAADVCSPPVILTKTHDPGFAFPVGMTTVKYIATDGAGNKDSCSFKVTIVDPFRPKLAPCPADINVNTATAACGAVVTWTNPTATDNCSSGLKVTSTPASGTNFALGPTTIKVVAEDASGNRDSCTFKVIVKDVEKPTFTCPSNVEITAALGSSSAVVNGIGLTNIKDNCAIDTVHYRITGTTNATGANNASGRSFNIGTSKVTYFVKDKSGNTDSCSFEVLIKASASVTITCPTNKTVNTNSGQCSAIVNALTATVSPESNLKELTYVLTGATTGNGTGDVSGKTFNLGTTTITYTATAKDNTFANCNFTVNVEDKQAPVFANCPMTKTASLPIGKCELAFEGALLPTATDNCNGLKLTYIPAVGSMLPPGKHAINVLARDTSGNTTTCAMELTVVDNEKPVFSNCPKDTIISTNQCQLAVSWIEPTAADNCTGTVVTKSHSPGFVFQTGDTTIKYTAKDASGNESTCSFRIRVEDKQPPLISNVPQNMTVNAVAGECGTKVNWTEPIASDSCGLSSFTKSATPGSFFNTGVHIVEYKATDKSGNVTTASFTITVKDTKAPTFVCPSSLTVILDGGGNDPSGFITRREGIDCQNVALFFPDVSAFDDCGPVTIVRTGGRTSGSSFPLGMNIQTYLATDRSGNQSTCSFGINVIAPAEAVAFSLPYSPCEGVQVTLSVNQYNGATYQWTNPKGNVVANTRTFVQDTTTASHNGVYTVSIALPTNCTLTSSVNLMVAPNPQINASANDLLCSGGHANLNLKAVSTGGAAVSSWSWTYPNGALVPQQNPIVANANVNNAGTYVVTATSAKGCVAKDTVLVAISKEPVMPPLFGTDANICVNKEVILNGQTFNGNNVNYQWLAVPATGSGLIAINNSIVKVKPTLPGTYTYKYLAIVDGCKSDTAEWVLKVEKAPDLVASVAGQTTCVSGNTSITLQETGGQAVSWTWEGLKTGFFSNQRNPVLANVTSGKSDNYKVTGVSANGCSASVILPVNITETPSAPVLMVNEASVCKGGSIVLSTTPAYSGDAFFNWTGPDLPNFRPSVQNMIITPMQTGTLTYTFSAVVNNCPSATATVNVRVEEPPLVNVTTEGETKCVSGTSSVILKSNATNSTSWSWTTAAGTVISTASSLQLNNITSANSGLYTIVAKNVIGCESKGTLQLAITDALPKITASLEAMPCIGGTMRLNSTLIPGVSYLWKNPAGNAFSAVQSPLISNVTAAFNGDYTVTATKDGCSTTSAPLKVMVQSAPKPVNDDVDVIYEKSKSFNVVANDQIMAPFTIKVTMPPSNGILRALGNGDFTYTPNLKYRETDRMVYEICFVECPLTCASAQVALNVRHDVNECVITTVISPNNDGINDEFVISCLEGLAFPDNSLTIFNQWGGKVFETAPYKNDWKGTYRGKDLPDGTYYYIFQRAPGSAAEKGFVMIHR